MRSILGIGAEAVCALECSRGGRVSADFVRLVSEAQRSFERELGGMAGYGPKHLVAYCNTNVARLSRPRISSARLSSPGILPRAVTRSLEHPSAVLPSSILTIAIGSMLPQTMRGPGSGFCPS